jgi:hypothetical protein
MILLARQKKDLHNLKAFSVRVALCAVSMHTNKRHRV